MTATESLLTIVISVITTVGTENIIYIIYKYKISQNNTVLLFFDTKDKAYNFTNSSIYSRLKEIVL